MTEIEKLAKAIFVDYRSSDPCEGSTWNSVDPEAKAQTIHVVRVVLQHLHDNIPADTAGVMFDAIRMDENWHTNLHHAFQAAIASILADAP